MHLNSAFCKESQCSYVHTGLMRTVIFICRGRQEGIANVETYRDRQGQTRTDRDGQGQTGIDRDCPCLSMLVPAYPCLSLLVPACPCQTKHRIE